MRALNINKKTISFLWLRVAGSTGTAELLGSKAERMPAVDTDAGNRDAPEGLPAGLSLAIQPPRPPARRSGPGFDPGSGNHILHATVKGSTC